MHSHLRLILLLLSTFVIAEMSAQTHDALLLDYRNEIILKKDKLHTLITREIKIFNKEGEDYAEVIIPFSDLTKVSKIRAHIADRNGSIVKQLKKNDIVVRSAFSRGSFYQEHFVSEFTLKHNSYPYTLVYSYEIEEKEFFYVEHWQPVLSPDIPTRNASLKLVLPRDYRINYSQSYIDSFTLDSVKGSVIYNWKTSYDRNLVPEYYSDRIEYVLPSVVIVPEQFNFEIEGSFRTWEDYGKYQYKLIEDCSDLPLMEALKIQTLIQDISDTIEQIRILYHYLQDQTRYINITIETGGLKPYPASYVSENKYGDCKALSNYFKSVLEVIGIKSHYTLVYAGARIKKIDKSLPSQQFNHVILCVPLERDSIWLDCTSNGPFNYLGTFTQNRKALIIKDEGSHFATTPSMSLSDVTESRRIKLSYDFTGKHGAEFHNSYRGDTFESLSSLLRDVNNNSKERIIRNYFVDEDFELINHSVDLPPRDNKEIDFRYSAVSNRIYEKYGDDILINHVRFSFPRMEKPEIRKQDLLFSYPIYYIDTIDYDIPEGYAISTDTREIIVQSDYGEYTLDYELQDSAVRVIKSLKIMSGSYPLSEYRDYFEFSERVRDIESKPCMLLTKITKNDN